MTEKTEREIEIEFQRDCDKFVSNNVQCCQSSLVGEMLEKEIFNYEDIENLQYTYQEAKEDEVIDYDMTEATYDLDPLHRDVFEWWVVNDWLLGKLEDLHEPVLHNDYGDWWGRCCSGQAISMDYIIRKIYKDTME